MSIFKDLFQWLDDRLDLSVAVDFMRHKEVPHHGLTWTYYFGGLTMFFLVIQICSGILLLLYYRPTAEAAFSSVQFITARVPFGWLVRSVHSWSANLMILSAFLHMFTVALSRAYGRPRELTWWTGCAMLGLGFAFGFSGYLLPWNTLAFFATQVGTEMVSKVPLVGHWLLSFLRGGSDVTGATLTRFFGFHVAVLPMAMFGMLLMHLGLVQRQGMHVPRGREEQARKRKPISFFPNFVLRDLVVWLGGLAVLVLLATFFPWELGTKVDPFASAPAGIKPEWYFLFMFETLKLIPGRVLGIEGELLGLGGFTLGGLLWFLLPLLDRRDHREPRRPLLTASIWLVIVFIAGMTLLSFSGVL